ncbi:MAG TPA: glycosyltransferase family 4 protein, partial [Acidimicrobiales bacterium]|nr:glycosyltransferase family 4 protein [Acidimicrobiales bacterium]
MTAATTRVGVVGPLLGANPGWVVTQGEVLAAHLTEDGLSVQTTSAVVPRVRRAIDVARTVSRWRGSVDVVIVLAFSGAAFGMTELGIRSARRLGVPVIVWLHGGNLPEFVRRHPRRVRRVLDLADRLVAPSPYLAALGTALGREVAVIPNVLPAAAEATVRTSARPRVLWMRTFHPLYRPELAVETFARVRARHPDARLTLAGQDKGGLPAARSLVVAEGLDGSVDFPGFLDPAGKARAFADHDVFLNTTRVDNAPVSLLEAAAHGLVVVSTPAGGIVDLFHDGVDSLLAPDADGLADAIERVLTEPALAASLSAAALALARSADWAEDGPRWHR